MNKLIYGIYFNKNKKLNHALLEDILNSWSDFEWQLMGIVIKESNSDTFIYIRSIDIDNGKITIDKKTINTLNYVSNKNVLQDLLKDLAAEIHHVMKINKIKNNKITIGWTVL